MELVVVIASFVLLTMASFGLLASGIAAMRQARLAKRMFNFRVASERPERATEFESRLKKASDSYE